MEAKEDFSLPAPKAQLKEVANILFKYLRKKKTITAIVKKGTNTFNKYECK